MQETEDSKFEDIVLYDDVDHKFDGVNREVIVQLRSKLGEPSVDDFDGMVGIDAIIHQIGICGEYCCMGWEAERLQFIQ